MSSLNTRGSSTLLNGLILVSLLLLASACTPNRQLRTDKVADNCAWNQNECRDALVERYLEYDLGFIEFTERGNPYDRASVNKVLKLISDQANTQRGVAVFVFAHGWKHNARYDDSNVVQFREFLSRAAENEVVGKRKVVGVYLGWRGAFTNVPILKETTYWARKSVAEEVGAGGVTEIFAKLHQILVAQPSANSIKQKELGNYKNSFVIIGHSFGGAIVLSALHDVLLNDLVAANLSISDQAQQCERIKRFADALILINPAIEANKVILLKEAAARCRFKSDQPPLMHVISSDGDTATRVFFPVGEYANISSPLGPKRLSRTVNGKDIVLDERRLALVTAGNLQQLRTAYLSYKAPEQQWAMDMCSDDLATCGVTDKRQQANHFTVDKNDPLRFIKTDRVFIKNHNDAFGCYVQGFISSLILQTQFIEKGFNTPTAERKPQKLGSACMNATGTKFDMIACFNSQLDDYDCESPAS